MQLVFWVQGLPAESIKWCSGNQMQLVFWVQGSYFFWALNEKMKKKKKNLKQNKAQSTRAESTNKGVN